MTTPVPMMCLPAEGEPFVVMRTLAQLREEIGLLEYKTIGQFPIGDTKPLELPGLRLEELDEEYSTQRTRAANWSTEFTLVYDEQAKWKSPTPPPNQHIEGLFGTSYVMASVENSCTGDSAPFPIREDDIPLISEGLHRVQRVFFDPATVKFNYLFAKAMQSVSADTLQQLIGELVKDGHLERIESHIAVNNPPEAFAAMQGLLPM